MRILFFGTQMAIGGAQKVLLDQARWFQLRGYKVKVVFFYDKENLHEKWQKNADFPILVMTSNKGGMGNLKSAGELIRGLWNLWRLLRREQFEVIEAFTHDSNVLALPMAWLAGVSVRIATHHGPIDGFPKWREKLHTWIVNSKIVNELVAVSELTRQAAVREGVRPEKISVIRNGIALMRIGGINRLEVRKEAGIKSDQIFLLSVGRLVYQKAHEVLVAAIPSVLMQYPNVKLGICGDGVLRAQLESQIDMLGLQDSVKLLGRWDSVVNFLVAADVFVLPSRWEGLPIALLEAMSVGLPVIATNVEGVVEAVSHGRHGLLVPVDDAVALANALMQLLGDPQLLHDMGQAARLQIMKNYTEDIMCEQYLALMLKYLPEVVAQV